MSPERDEAGLDKRIGGLLVRLRNHTIQANELVREYSSLRDQRYRARLFVTSSALVVGSVVAAVFASRFLLLERLPLATEALIVLMPAAIAAAVLTVVLTLDSMGNSWLYREASDRLRYTARVLQEAIRAASQFREQRPRADASLMAELDFALFDAESALRRSRVALGGSGSRVNWEPRGRDVDPDRPQVTIARALKALTDAKSVIGYENAIRVYINGLLDQVLEYLGQSGSVQVRVKTSALYTEIIKMIKTAANVRILDQDVFRWDELISDKRIALNVINYSSQILHAMIERAHEQNTGFKLRRIFVINPSWLAEGINRERVRSILTEIDTICSAGAARIQNSILYMTQWGQEDSRFANRVEFNHISDLVAHLHDIVIFDADAMYREEITYRNRVDASESDAEIIIDPKRILEASDAFDSLDAYLYTIPEFLALHTLGAANHAL